MDDLDHATVTKAQATESTPVVHLDSAGWLHNLGNSLQGRVEDLMMRNPAEKSGKITSDSDVSVENKELDTPNNDNTTAQSALKPPDYGELEHNVETTTPNHKIQIQPALRLSPLPEGWEMRLAHPTMKPYYVDHNTKTTTWNHPRFHELPEVRSALKIGPMPDGWEMNINERDQVFYINHKTKTTTWNHPRLHELPDVQSALKIGPMPDGWEMRINESNRVYYIDHNTKSTTWVHPLNNSMSAGF